MERERTRQARERAKAAKARERSTERQLKKALKTLKDAGAYEPTSDVLTPWRKRKIRQLEKEYRQFLNPDEFFFRSAPKSISNVGRKNLREGAQAQGYKATRKGVFIPKKTVEGGVEKTFTRARIERSTLRGKRAWRVVEERITKKGTIEKHVVPLVKADFVVGELRDMETELADIKRKMRKGDSIRFLIGRTGLSFEAYAADAIDMLLRKLQFYKDTVGAVAQMLAHTRFVITRQGETRQGMIRRLIREGEMDEINPRRRR